MTLSEYARTSKPTLEICHCETQTYKNELVPHKQKIFLIFERKELNLQGKNVARYLKKTNYTALSSSMYFKAHNSFSMKQNTKRC